jgi:WD40 repeat protein/uncharacterized caspase-like protein
MKKHLLNILILFCMAGFLQAQNRPRLVLPEGIHSIQSLCFSPDGKYLLVGDEKMTHLMELSTGKELNILEGILLEKGESISRNQKWGITKTDSGLNIWDIAGGWSQKKFIQKTKGTSITTLFNDERLLKSSYDTAGKSYRFRIMDIRTNKEISELPAGEGVYSARFSTKGGYIATTGWQGELRIQEIETGKEKLLKGHSGLVLSATFSHDDKFLLSTGADSTARLFDVENGREIWSFPKHKASVLSGRFSPDGGLVLTNGADSIARVFDTRTGKLLSTFRQNNFFINENKSGAVPGAEFSQDGKKILLKFQNRVEIRESVTGKLLKDYSHASRVICAIFSPDGKQIASTDGKSVLIWEADKISTLEKAGNESPEIRSLSLCPDGKSIISAYSDSTLRRWEMASGKELKNIKCQLDKIYSVELSSDERYILVSNLESVILLDAYSGKELHKISKEAQTVNWFSGRFYNAEFNSEGTKIIFTEELKDKSGNNFSRRTQIRKVQSWNDSLIIISSDNRVPPSIFSPDGKYILANGNEIRSSETGSLIKEIYSERKIYNSSFSPDGNLLLIHPESDFYFRVIEVESGKEISRIPSGNFGQSNREFNRDGNEITSNKSIKIGLTSAEFSPDGKEILIVYGISKEGQFFPITKVVNLKSGKETIIQCGRRKSARFCNGGKSVITIDGYDTNIWDAKSGKKLFTRRQLSGSKEFLIYDEHYRFDGTPGAMEKLYFVCGLEATELGQMKDALYVPGLAEKILNGEEINYKKLSDLDFCNALPLLELQKEDSSGREFRIQQRRWPLNRIDIKVGGKTVKTLPAAKLGFKDQQAIFRLSHAELEKHLVAGMENTVELLAVSQDKGSEFQSKCLKFSMKGPMGKGKPKLFMLLIGVNDYKDDALDLRFPVQDARSLGEALQKSAGKLLGKENVEVWHVQSRLAGQPVFTTPERAGVMKALEEIGKKARSQDVLFIFFAGHGVMQGAGEKAFTFLTADASKINPVGISTRDLKEWLSPEGPFQMMPNKTILVYDACNSGQAAKELVSALTRDNDATERIRQIEDLGYKSGLFILSASAPDKPAYEIPKLGQGLLTYSMLYTLKNNPLVMDENLDGSGFLNVQKWFLETEREQDRIMSSLGLKQKAQPYGSANIRIGMVDEEVRNSISLQEEKPLVYCSNARDENDEDPLDLKNRLNDFLENAQARGITSDLAFVPTETSAAHVVKLVYQMRKEKVQCRILVFRNKIKIHESSAEAGESAIVKEIVEKLEAAIK